MNINNILQAATEGEQYKMENNDNNDSATGGEQESSTTDSRTKQLSQCELLINHSYQCSAKDCYYIFCHKMKVVLEHNKTCTQKNTKDGCLICKRLMEVCTYHAKHCRQLVCYYPYCAPLKVRYRESQLKAQARQLRKRISAMQNRRSLNNNILQKNHRSSNNSNQPSCAARSHSAVYSQQSNANSSSGPPIGALLAVQQVQAAAARQAAAAQNLLPQMDIGFPSDNVWRNPSWRTSIYAQNQQFYQNTQLGMQAMGGSNSVLNSTNPMMESPLVMSNPGPSTACIPRSPYD